MKGIEYIVILLILLAMEIDARLDYRQIQRNVPINHFRHTLWIGLLVVFLFVAAKLSGLSWGLVLGFAFVFPFVRWIYHDYRLNALRGLPLHYLGTSAKTDKLLRFFRERWGIPSFLIRLVALSIGTSLALIINHYV